MSKICFFMQQRQSIGIHDVLYNILFNTELAMHFWAIFKYGCFQQICERRETLLLCLAPYMYSVSLMIKLKSKTGPETRVAVNCFPFTLLHED